MAYPTKYERQYDFVTFQNANPSRPLPADKVNADLNFVEQSVDEIVEFLKTSLRSDGVVANESIGRDQLTDEVNTRLDAAQGDIDALVDEVIAQFVAPAVDIAFTPAGGIAATNVQAALEELDTEKAKLASPVFTGTVGGITKSMVGLGNVDNTADASKPVSTAQQTALDLKANLASPTFSGTVTLPPGTVTLAMQANMATASVVYRKTAAAGAPEVNTLATLKTDLGLTGTNSGDQTVPAAAAQSDQETSTSITTFVSPGRQQFHPSAAKCWALVTVATGTPTLVSNYNITSITDTGVGILTITIATDFSDANWCPTATLEWPSGATGVIATYSGRAAGSVVIHALDAAAAADDPIGYGFVGFGDQ